MGTKFVDYVSLTTVNCGECGGVYAITEKHRAHCEKNRKNWNCPYCKTGWGFSYLKEDDRREAEKLREQLEIERKRHDRTRQQRDLNEHRRRAEKGHRTRIQRRIAHGVCPCCNRSFKDLQRHMESQHPDFIADVSD